MITQQIFKSLKSSIEILEKQWNIFKLNNKKTQKDIDDPDVVLVFLLLILNLF